MEPDADLRPLFERASQGDGPSLDRLLERYLPQLHAFVRARVGPRMRCRESSMDVVQSVCRQLLATQASFDFRGEEYFRAWLFTSALNKIRDKLRFHRLAMRDVGREEAIDDSWTTSLAASWASPSGEAAGRELAAALDDALAALSDEHREVITLARIARLPHRVVAEVMNRRPDAVRQLLGRALLGLHRELRRRGFVDDEPQPS